MPTADKLYKINRAKTELDFHQTSSPIQPTLYPYQQDTVDRAPDKRLLAYDTGTGKTITSISLVNKKGANNVLVIAPKTNVEQWGIELSKYIDKNVVCKVLSKEEFKKQVKTLPSYQAVIVDEGHYFAGIKSALSKALYWYLNNKNSQVKYVYICTATPYCSTPFNIYTLAKHLGYSWNYEAFKNKFFYYIPMGSRAVPQLRKGMEDEVAKLVKEIGDTVDIKDVVEVPEQEESVIKIPLTKPQLDAIRDNFDPVFIVRWTKQHQIENGFLYEEGYPTQTFDNNKTKEVLRLASKYEKIIFVARYTQQIELYETELKKLGYNVMTLTGSTKNRQEVIEAANAAPRCVLLIQASVSAGYELPTFRVMVFASLSFSYVDKKQAAGRILRINHLHENKYIYLVSEGVDQDVYDCIRNKHDFTLKIYEKNN